VDLRLEGQVVLVTGGSDGLGRALCHRLVEEGARVALCGRDPEKLATTAGALEAVGGDVLAVAADVSRPEDLARLVEATVARFGSIDGLVNNAGRASAKRLAESSDADWHDDLELKVMAAVRLTRMVLPHFRLGGGSVLNVLAIAGKAPGAGSTPTSVSRAAGLALTKALSKELGSDGVRVNAILIGLVESGQWERQADAQGITVDELYRRMGEGSGIPLGRVGRAEEFADLAAYLLSDRASYVSGTAVNLDGGLSPVV